MLRKKSTGSWEQRVAHLMKARQAKNKNLVKALAESATLSRLALLPAIKPPRNTSIPKVKPPTQVDTPAPGKWLKAHHATLHDGGTLPVRMQYWLYLPSKQPANPMPLMVMLHGCAQSATQFAQSTRMNQLAEEKGFAVLYPQLSATQGPARCWGWYKKDVQQGGSEVQSVVGVINDVVQRYRFDRSRIYIAGISAGAAMAHIIAMNHPQLIAAVGMHSGSLFGVAQSPLEGIKVMQHGAASALHDAIHLVAKRIPQYAPMPAVLVHGAEDVIVRPVNLYHLAEQFREINHIAGFDHDAILVKLTERQASAQSNAYKCLEYFAGKKMLLKVCEVYGLGHAWSGGDETIRFSDGKGPDASRLMWDFFAQHRREIRMQLLPIALGS